MCHLEVSLLLRHMFSPQWKPKGGRKENAGKGEDLASRNKCHELTQTKTTFPKKSVLTCMIVTYTADNPGSQPKDISSITGQSLHKDKMFLSNFCNVLDTNRFFLKTEVMSGFLLHLF